VPADCLIHENRSKFCEFDVLWPNLEVQKKETKKIHHKHWCLFRILFLPFVTNFPLTCHNDDFTRESRGYSSFSRYGNTLRFTENSGSSAESKGRTMPPRRCNHTTWYFIDLRDAFLRLQATCLALATFPGTSCQFLQTLNVS